MPSRTLRTHLYDLEQLTTRRDGNFLVPTYLGDVVLTLSSGGAQHELGTDSGELGEVLREVGKLFGGVLLVGGGNGGGGEPLLPGGRLGPSVRVPFEVQRLRSGHHAHPHTSRHDGPHAEGALTGSGYHRVET